MTTPARGALRLVEPGEAPPPAPLSVLAALPLAVAVLDAGGRFRFANPAAEQFFGTSEAQLLHLSLADLLPADNPLFLLIAQVRANGVTVLEHGLALESPLLHKPAVAVQAAPLPELAGAVVLTLREVSAARVLDRQEGFRRAARSVAGMAAVLAHEVKNPLSGIRGAAQLLEAAAEAPDRELAVLIRDEADRIRALVDRMEVFGARPVARGPVNIHRVLEHVRLLAESGFAAGLRFREAYDPSLPPVAGDRDQLIQVVLNLVKNAAEALREAGALCHQPDGEIVLTTAWRHGARLSVPGGGARVDLPLVVSVRDNGPGIDEAVRTSLFEPFVGARPGGSGLGLALVAKLVADHGGLIEVESRPGRTEFRLLLPVAAP